MKPSLGGVSDYVIVFSNLWFVFTTIFYFGLWARAIKLWSEQTALSHFSNSTMGWCAYEKWIQTNYYKQLWFCRKNKGLELYAYVIMTNRIHLIARAKESFLLSDIICDFKKVFPSSQCLLALLCVLEGHSEKEKFVNSLVLYQKF